MGGTRALTLTVVAYSCRQMRPYNGDKWTLIEVRYNLRLSTSSAWTATKYEH